MANILNKTTWTKSVSVAGWVNGEYTNYNVFYGTPEACDQLVKDTTFPKDWFYTNAFGMFAECQ